MKLLTVYEAAEYLTIKKSKMWNLKKDFEIPHVRIGRQVRFREQDLEKYVNSHVVRSNGRHPCN